MSYLKESVFLSHSGKQHAYHVAHALQQLGFLNEFYTSSYVTSGNIQRLVNLMGNKFLSKRFIPGLYGSKIKAHWQYELKEFVLSKLSQDRQKIQEAVYQRDVNFDKMVSGKLKSSKAKYFWGFQGSCYASLRSAKAAGVKAICELSTGHVIESVRILGEEAKLQPKWADSFDNLLFPSAYLKRLENEPHEAEVVIAASSFTKKTLIKSGIDQSKIRVLPLGFDHRFIHFNKKESFEGKLKLLYTGRVTQRKGVSYLLEAMRHLKSYASLDIIGFVHGKGEGLKGYEGYYNLSPPLNQYDLFKAYCNFDALVLPSLFEGFGLVIIEAMAAGLPVITTRNTIGADIVKDGFNGYLVDIRDAKAIENAVKRLAEKSDNEKYQMRINARQTALEYSWETYRSRLNDVLNGI